MMQQPLRARAAPYCFTDELRQGEFTHHGPGELRVALLAADPLDQAKPACRTTGRSKERARHALRELITHVIFFRQQGLVRPSQARNARWSSRDIRFAPGGHRVLLRRRCRSSGRPIRVLCHRAVHEQERSPMPKPSKRLSCEFPNTSYLVLQTSNWRLEMDTLNTTKASQPAIHDRKAPRLSFTVEIIPPERDDVRSVMEVCLCCGRRYRLDEDSCGICDDCIST